ncbi:MAG TPA: heme biosynthesis HemY N-terminal domain-containing protein [Rhodocyclaceae bacterium]
MRSLLRLLLLATLAVGLALAARYNEGYALFVLPPWRVELSLNLLLLILLVVFFIGYFAVRMLGAMAHLPARVAAFRARQAELKGEAALRESLRALLEGRFAQAVKRAEKSFELNHAPGLSALIALSAAHGLRDERRRDYWRERAMRHDTETRAARLMVESEQALENRDFAGARETLETLAKESGRHVAALRLSLRAHQGSGNWQAVLRLLRQLEKHKAMTPEQAAVLRRRAHRENLRLLGGDTAALERYLRSMDDGDRHEPRLALDAARAMLAVGNPVEAARIVEAALDEQWDGALIGLYGEIAGGDVLGRLSHSEKWLHQRPRDAELLLTLGRLCRQRELWGKSRSYLEASLSISPSRAAHVELAQLLELLGEEKLAQPHYRAAATL